ncbi:MAG: hypothetical protein HPY67_15925 [Syntrophaceae bacterium]|nr:hypothetical protein [Syntrophaceae bacterium]
MRIDGATGTGHPDRATAVQGVSPAGALVPAGSGEGRRGHFPQPPHVPPDGFAVVHDPAHGAVVIDLCRTILQKDESPTYRLSREGTFEIGSKPRKGGLIDLRA